MKPQMTLEKAKALAAPHAICEDYKTIVVTSDGAVYLDNPIAAMKQHAKEHKLDLYIIRGEDVENTNEDDNSDDKKELKKSKKK
jgi:hypothetical protein